MLWDIEKLQNILSEAIRRHVLFVLLKGLLPSFPLTIYFFQQAIENISEAEDYKVTFILLV